MTIREAVNIIAARFPVELVTDHDNVGLIVGNYDDECKKISMAYELNENVVNEAVKRQVDLLITYHTPLFRPAKSFTTSTSHPNPLVEAARSRLNIFAIHTALDVVRDGLNFDLAARLGMKHLRFLSPLKDTLYKLVVFAPETHADQVRHAMAQAGAGKIGNYLECSFSVNGVGTFVPNDSASPFVGESGKLDHVEETKIEMVVEKHRLRGVLNAMSAVHPYEEVAYDLYPLKNEAVNLGFGVMGDLEPPLATKDFLSHLKETLELEFLKVSNISDRDVRKVALCAGSGYTFYNDAIRSGADIFITGDVKHHDFREAKSCPTVLVDATHQGTERFVTELMYRLIEKLFKGKVEVESIGQRLENALVF